MKRIYNVTYRYQQKGWAAEEFPEGKSTAFVMAETFAQAEELVSQKHGEKKDFVIDEITTLGFEVLNFYEITNQSQPQSQQL